MFNKQYFTVFEDLDEVLVTEERCVAAFKYGAVINHIAEDVYLASKDKDLKEFKMTYELPDGIKNLTVNIIYSNKAGGQYDYNYDNFKNATENGIEELEINLKFNFKKRPFDWTTLFRMLYHELNHIFEYYHRHSLLGVAADIIFDLGVLNTAFDNSSKVYHFALCGGTENILSELFNYNVYYMFRCMYVPIELRGLVAGLYGELLSYVVYGNLTLDEAIDKSQVMVCLRKSKDILEVCHSIPQKDILTFVKMDDSDIENSDFKTKEVHIKDNPYNGIKYYEVLYTLLSTAECMFKYQYLIKDEVEDPVLLYDYIKRIIKIIEKSVIKLQCKCRQVASLFETTDEKLKPVVSDFIKNVVPKIGKEDAEAYKRSLN